MRARLWSQPAGQGGERHPGSGQRPVLEVGMEGSATHTRGSVECGLERCVPRIEAGSQRTWGVGRARSGGQIRGRGGTAGNRSLFFLSWVGSTRNDAFCGLGGGVGRARKRENGWGK